MGHLGPIAIDGRFANIVPPAKVCIQMEFSIGRIGFFYTAANEEAGAETSLKLRDKSLVTGKFEVIENKSNRERP
jgi:hypothetical protein